jgi:hypothetical protein
MKLEILNDDEIIEVIVAKLKDGYFDPNSLKVAKIIAKAQQLATLKVVSDWLKEHRNLETCPECLTDYGINKEEFAELDRLVEGKRV